MISLGSGSAAVQAAQVLSGSRQVLVNASSQAEYLNLSLGGFIPIVRELHVIARCDREYGSYSRRQRRILREQQRLLKGARLHIRILGGDVLGDSRIEMIFYQLVSPSLSRHRISPFDLDRFRIFRETVRRSLVVTAADYEGRFRVVDLLSLSPISRLVLGSRFLGEALGTQRVIPCGLVRCMGPGLPDFRRYWAHCVGKILNGLGFNLWSFGADDPYVDPNYATVIVDKLRWGEGVAWRRSPKSSQDFMNFGPPNSRFHGLVEDTGKGIQMRLSSESDRLSNGALCSCATMIAKHTAAYGDRPGGMELGMSSS